MKPENKRMQEFLQGHGITARVKYIFDGTLKGCWRLYASNQRWNLGIEAALTKLGFVGFDGKVLDMYSGNGGAFSLFVRGHNELLKEEVTP